MASIEDPFDDEDLENSSDIEIAEYEDFRKFMARPGEREIVINYFKFRRLEAIELLTASQTIHNEQEDAEIRGIISLADDVIGMA